MKLLHVPVIDISTFRNGDLDNKLAVAKQVEQACKDIGFLVISGHGVSSELISNMREVSREFFDLPLEEKLRVSRPAPDVTRGYIGMEEESIGRIRDAYATAGDLNESFMIGPVDLPDESYAFAPTAGKHFAPNLWPDNPDRLRETWTEYYREMGGLARTLMQIFAVALNLEEDFFDNKVDRHISRLRVRNYPAPKEPPMPGQIRAGAHSDYGSLTILAAEDKPGGLQVYNAEGEWVDVPVIPGCYIINIGDLMARWTNDAWVSTLHRVVNPPIDSGENSRRQSLVFFHNPNYDADISCLPSCTAAGEMPKYSSITSGDYLRQSFMTTQNK